MTQCQSSAVRSPGRSFDSFDANYEPMPAPGDDACLLREHHEVVHANPNRVWTVVETDEDRLLILPGFHLVNRLGYLLTRKPWQADSEEFDYLPD